MRFQKRFMPLLLALVLALGTLPVQAAALTRGEAAQALLSAAQDYNPGVQRSDILKGYPDGSLALDGHAGTRTGADDAHARLRRLCRPCGGQRPHDAARKQPDECSRMGGRRSFPPSSPPALQTATRTRL